MDAAGGMKGGASDPPHFTSGVAFKVVDDSLALPFAKSNKERLVQIASFPRNWEKVLEGLFFTMLFFCDKAPILFGPFKYRTLCQRALA